MTKLRYLWWLTTAVRRNKNIISFLICQVEETGFYAPLTANGNLIVNNVLASCHSNMAIQTLQQTFFAWWRTLNSLISRLIPAIRDAYSIAQDHRSNQDVKHENSIDGDLPLGVHYLITVMELFVPKHVFFWNCTNYPIYLLWNFYYGWSTRKYSHLVKINVIFLPFF